MITPGPTKPFSGLLPCLVGTRTGGALPKALLAGLAATFAACTGSIGGTESAGTGANDSPSPGGSGGSPTGKGGSGAPGTSSMPMPPIVASADLAAISGLRRLTVREYDNVLRDLLGDNTHPSDLLLPEDIRRPFDNDFAIQAASPSLIEGMNALAWEAADRLMGDAPRRDMVVGCKPVGITDAACFHSFVTNFGRRALRRPLSTDEATRFEALAAYGTEAKDFYEGVRTAVVAFLQHGNLAYRVEVGAPVAGKTGLYKLDGFEVATRISFFLWGTIPDNALLDSAQKGELATGDGIRVVAARMMKDARAKEMTARFHALWLGYENLTGDLAPAMLQETSALMDRVVFTDRLPWRELFRFGETFATDALAKHYGMPGTGQPTAKWIPMTDGKRRGLLSQGSFLSIGGSSFADTSPTLRGKAIRNKLLCQDIPPPPPTVDQNKPPGNPADCKEQRYIAHRAGGCANCHALMDPIGFGLENYERDGLYRETEKGRPDCKIRGVGEVAGIGTFNGPAELGDLLANSGALEPCLATQVYRFAVGRATLDDNDARFMVVVTEAMKNSKAGLRLDDFFVNLVSSEAFRHRREEVTQ